MKNKISLFFLIFTFAAIIPGTALASGGVSEFTRPLEQFADLLGGPWIKIIGILGFIFAGGACVILKKSLEDQTRDILYIIMGLCVVLAASSLVSNFFGFSGALIA